MAKSSMRKHVWRRFHTGLPVENGALLTVKPTTISFTLNTDDAIWPLQLEQSAHLIQNPNAERRMRRITSIVKSLKAQRRIEVVKTKLRGGKRQTSLSGPLSLGRETSVPLGYEDRGASQSSWA
jgi:hypothetical protein